MLTAYFLLHVRTHFSWSIWKSLPASWGTHICNVVMQLSMCMCVCAHISLPINCIVSNCNLQVECILPLNKVAGSNFCKFLIEIAQSQGCDHRATAPQNHRATVPHSHKYIIYHTPAAWTSLPAAHIVTQFWNVEVQAREGNETYRIVSIDFVVRVRACGGNLCMCKCVCACILSPSLEHL